MQETARNINVQETARNIIDSKVVQIISVFLGSSLGFFVHLQQLATNSILKYCLFFYFFLLITSLIANILADITSIHDFNKSAGLIYASDQFYITPWINRFFEIALILALVLLQFIIGYFLKLCTSFLVLILLIIVPLIFWIFLTKTASPK